MMPKITIYNDSDTDLDADFDVVELMDGKEVARKTMEPDPNGSEDFRLYAFNQAFLILPRGMPCPKIERPKVRGQIDARPRRAEKV